MNRFIEIIKSIAAFCSPHTLLFKLAAVLSLTRKK